MSESGELSVRVSKENGCSVVQPTGDVNFQTTPNFYDMLLEQIEARPRKLVIDLSGVPYMDSSGVGTLVEVKRRIEKSGGKLVLTAPQASVRGVFEITQLHKFFTIVASVEEACKA